GVGGDVAAAGGRVVAELGDVRVGAVGAVIDRAEVRLVVPDVALVVHRAGEVQQDGDVAGPVGGDGGGRDGAGADAQGACERRAALAVDGRLEEVVGVGRGGGGACLDLEGLAGRVVVIRPHRDVHGARIDGDREDGVGGGRGHGVGLGAGEV